MSKVETLKVIDSLTVAMDDTTYIGRIERYLIDNDLVILTDDDFSDVELMDPLPAYVLLGPLNFFEKKCFCLHSIIDSLIQDIIIDVQATQAEHIAKLMREERIQGQAAYAKVIDETSSALLTEKDRLYLNTLMVCTRNLTAAFEWSVRTRYGLFDYALTVRSGFKVYSYNSNDNG